MKIKQLLFYMILICMLVFSISAFAEEVTEIPPAAGMQMPDGGRGGRIGNMEQPANIPQGEMPPMPDMRQGIGGGRGGMPSFELRQEPESVSPGGVWGFINTYFTHIFSAVALVFGFLFVILYKRKNY